MERANNLRARLKFQDIFDVEELRKIQDSFAQITGIGSVIKGLNGDLIVQSQQYIDLLSSIKSLGNDRITEKVENNFTDEVIGKSLEYVSSNSNSSVQYYSNQGVCSCSVNITVGSLVLGIWSTSHVLIAEDFNREDLANNLHVDVEIIDETVAKLPKVQKAHFQSIGQFLLLLAEQFSRMALQNIRQTEEIAERIIAEHEKEQAYSNINRIFEIMPAGMVLINYDKKIIRVNSTALELFKAKSVHEVVGRPCYEFLCSENHPCPILNSEKPGNKSENVLKQLGGTEVPILKSAAKTLFQNEEVLLEVFIDISDLKHAERQLKESQERLLLSMEVANIGMWEWNVEKDEIIFTLNWYTMLGYTPEELGNNIKSWYELQHPDDWRQINRIFYQHQKGVTPVYQIEHRAKSKSGEWVWLNSCGKIIERDKRGRAVRVIGTSTDINERKKLEVERIEMQKKLVETARQAGMAEVATNVLHNVGNILNSVNVSSKVFQQKIERSRIKNLDRIVEMFEANKDNLGDFITHNEKGKIIPGYLKALTHELSDERESILRASNDLSKNVEHVVRIIELQQTFSKNTNVLETLSIRDVIEDAVNMTAKSLNRRNISLRRNYFPLPHFQMDRHKVIQVLINLIRNSVSAIEDNVNGKGESSVDEKYLEISTKINHENEMVQVLVRDNGIGISPDRMTKIFSYGFTTKQDGHGYGLHSAALAAQEMGGSLRGISEGPGTGATFVLEIPFKI